MSACDTGRFYIGRFLMGRLLMGRFLWFGLYWQYHNGQVFMGRLGLAFLAIFTGHIVPMGRFGLAFGQCQAKPAHLI